jgi:hypothetical protein
MIKLTVGDSPSPNLAVSELPVKDEDGNSIEGIYRAVYNDKRGDVIGVGFGREIEEAILDALRRSENR